MVFMEDDIFILLIVGIISMLTIVGTMQILSISGLTEIFQQTGEVLQSELLGPWSMEEVGLVDIIRLTFN